MFVKYVSFLIQYVFLELYTYIYRSTRELLVNKQYPYLNGGEIIGMFVELLQVKNAYTQYRCCYTCLKEVITLTIERSDSHRLNIMTLVRREHTFTRLFRIQLNIVSIRVYTKLHTCTIHKNTYQGQYRTKYLHK